MRWGKFARRKSLKLLKHLDEEGNLSPTPLAARQDRLENCHMLQELAGTANLQFGKFATTEVVEIPGVPFKANSARIFKALCLTKPGMSEARLTEHGVAGGRLETVKSPVVSAEAVLLTTDPGRHRSWISRGRDKSGIAGLEHRPVG